MRIIPSVFSSLSLPKNIHTMAFEISNIKTRVEKMLMLIANPDISKRNPNTIVSFERFEPIIVPSARFPCPFLIADMLRDNSGIEVPIDIIVAPIKDPVISRALAIFEAIDTEMLAPIKTPTSPKDRVPIIFKKLAFHTNLGFSSKVILCLIEW